MDGHARSRARLGAARGSRHPELGRVYAAYGGIYVVVALVWLWRVDKVRLTAWDLIGAAVAVTGMGIIVWGGWRSA